MCHDVTHPAFEHLQHDLVWNDIDQEQNRLLTNWSGLDGLWKKLNTRHKFPLGYYRCQGKEKEFFVKVLLPNHGNKTLLAERVVKHLAVEISSVVPALSTEENIIDYKGAKASLIIYPYISQYNTKKASVFISAIAHELAALHASLHEIYNKDKIEEASKSRMSSLQKIWGDIQNASFSFDIPRDAREILLKNKLSLFDIFLLNPQVIHGDLNRRNILFTKDENKSTPNVFFIDFEDCLHTYSSPLQDVAFVIERFIFTEPLTILQIKQQTHQLLSCYQQSNSNTNLSFVKLPSDWLITMLLALSIKSLLLLSQLSLTKNQLVLRNEWDKFIERIRFVESQRDNLLEIIVEWQRLNS